MPPGEAAGADSCDTNASEAPATPAAPRKTRSQTAQAPHVEELDRRGPEILHKAAKKIGKGKNIRDSGEEERQPPAPYPGASIPGDYNANLLRSLLANIAKLTNDVATIASTNKILQEQPQQATEKAEKRASNFSNREAGYLNNINTLQLEITALRQQLTTLSGELLKTRNMNSAHKEQMDKPEQTFQTGLSNLQKESL
ncbi:hypothetical protein BBP40_004056 [Aspergillus hancockii]|nr:hypothetical protein BBP40_004056 [Aspergillus hancockii]